MKRFLFLMALLSGAVLQAQEIVKDTVRTDIVVTPEGDTIFGKMIELPEIVIYNNPRDAEAMKNFMILQNRVYKVYPYAKIASERLTELDRNMARLKTDKERKKYFKIVEKYIEGEFTDRLKKLSRKQGQILVKLIHRQTGNSAFDLVKEYKSGWKAFWASNTAKVFDINLKAKYDPYNINEDYLIETILVRAFQNGRLIEQPAANPVDYDKLSDYWIQRLESSESKN